MQSLMPVIKEVVVSGLVAKATSRDRSPLYAGGAILLLAGFIALLGIVYMSFAAYGWLATLYEPYIAQAITFGGLLVLSAGLLYSGLRIIRREKQQTAAYSHDEISQLVDLLSEEVVHEVAEPIKKNPKTALAAAAIAGFFADEFLH